MHIMMMKNAAINQSIDSDYKLDMNNRYHLFDIVIIFLKYIWLATFISYGSVFKM